MANLISPKELEEMIHDENTYVELCALGKRKSVRESQHVFVFRIAKNIVNNNSTVSVVPDATVHVLTEELYDFLDE